jgi:hypothetical protein
MLCITIKAKLRALLKNFDSYIDTHIDTALKISQALKNILASPVADILTAIIPGDADNVIRQKLTDALSKVIEALAIADACKQYADLNDQLNCFVNQLRQRDPQLQDAILQKLASLLAGNLDGLRLSQSLYDLYTQAKYAATKP